MKNIEIRTGQTLRIRTINGHLVIEQHANGKYPTQVLFYIQNFDGACTRTYEIPVTGLPKGMDIDVDTTVDNVSEAAATFAAEKADGVI